MARVLFACRMDAEPRAVLAEKNANAFEAVILADLPESEVAAAWSTADVLVTTGFGREIPADLAARAPRLRMVQTLVAGVDHLPYRSFPRFLVVCGNAGAYNVSVGEHALALLLAAAKDIPQRTREIASGVFDQSARSKALAGATVLVLGMGGIGTYVARACKALGMHVVGVGRSGTVVPPADEGGRLDDLPRLLPHADYVVLALPLTARTLGLVNRTFLAAMKEGAVLVNVARGKIVDEDDLYEHLRSHPEFRAALDVWWVYPDGDRGHPFHRPFHELPNVVMTPHNANAIPGQRRWAMEAALNNVLRYLNGETPRNVVNVPDYDSVAEPR
ncbi:MAG TPA: hydroxyacid dehydrogenase [Thermoplasmata archaeon]|nr:hydroxyacid dehydrogenase [Thermoplasmata archaeon]